MNKKNIMNKKIIILSGIKWNDTLQRHQTLAILLANLGYEVYFVEGIISSSFSFKKLFRHFQNRNVKNNAVDNHIPDNVHIVSGRFVNPNGGFFHILNRSIIKKILSKIGSEFEIIINYLPINTAVEFVERLNYKTLIYDCVRDFQNWGGYPNNLPKIEEWLCNKSDLIFTDSFYLTDKMKNKYVEKVIQILPTVDKKLCENYSNRKDKIEAFGYIGTLGEHVDVKLLKELADKGYTIHVFGKLDIPLDFSIVYHGFYSDMDKLFKEVIDSVDALIIPYKGNMDGVIPAKTMQCLAIGLPVFISEFYDSVFLKKYFYLYKDFDDLIEILNKFNFDEFIYKLDMVKQFVEDNTTTALTNKIKGILDER